MTSTGLRGTRSVDAKIGRMTKAGNQGINAGILDAIEKGSPDLGPVATNWPHISPERGEW